VTELADVGAGRCLMQVRTLPAMSSLYKNTLEKRLHITREGYGLTAQTRRCSNTSAMLAIVFLYGNLWC
jgi:hypothetical protein